MSGTGKGNPDSPVVSTVNSPIVSCVDKRYVAPLGVLMESLAVTHGLAVGELRLVVGYRDLEAAQCREIRARAACLELAVELRRAPEQVPFPVHGWMSDAVYLRLALPQILPGEPVRCI